MPISTAELPTDRPGRYAKQLVAHLSHRIAGDWNDADGVGWLDFGSARATLRSRDGALDMTVIGDDTARAEDVISRHLLRFLNDDETTIEWTRGGSA